MSQDQEEETKVEIRQERAETTDQTPRKGLEHVCSVVRLANDTPPSRGQQQVTVLSLDIGRVLDSTPRKLREGLTINEGAILFHTETVLLGVTSVKNVIGSKEHGIDTNGIGPAVRDGFSSGQFVLHEVNGRIAIGEGDTSHVPENKHETCKQ